MHSNHIKGPFEAGAELIRQFQDRLFENRIARFVVMADALSIGLKEVLVNKLLSMFLECKDFCIQR